jgi:CubicO group peptidase (beta-lactamase class C family)
MADQNTAGLLVLQDGQVRVEKYGPDFGPTGRWTSFSVAKSFTSTLVGAAIKDGYIKSLDDPVTRYIHGLQGSAYDGVTVRQLLTMTSGVKWNEDYTDPKSDVARLFSDIPPAGEDATVAYMKKLPREAPPGSKWVYKTGETNLIGVLVRESTGKTLADYLSEKIWRPFGMEQDGVWLVDNLDHEPGGCCLSAAMRDYGRFGQLILDGGRIKGRDILPEGWLAAATRKQADTSEPGQGYGYQWWTRDDGTFGAEGIFGQAVHIDPKRRLVVVVLSAWPDADPPERWTAQDKLFSAIAEAVDREAAARH